MSDHAEMAERHGAILAELSELGLSLARDLHQRAMTAETPDEAAGLAGAFHRISRSVRQSLALEARLERDRCRADREDQAEIRREHERRVSRRKAQVRAAVERLVWTEAEDDVEAERLVDDLEMLLDEEVLADDFAADPLDAHIERIAADLGLSSALPVHGEGGPSATPPAGRGPPPPSMGEADDWRSSA